MASLGTCIVPRSSHPTLSLLVFGLAIVALRATLDTEGFGSINNNVQSNNVPCPTNCTCSMKEVGILMICLYTNTITLAANNTISTHGRKETNSTADATLSHSAVDKFDFCQWPRISHLEVSGVPICCVNVSCLASVDSIVYTADSDEAACLGDPGDNLPATMSLLSVRNVPDLRHSCLFPWHLLGTVEKLDLSSNGIENLDVFCGQRAADVHGLDLSSNSINTVPWDGLACLQNLVSFDLSNNLLQTVDAEMNSTYLQNIRYLNLSHNHIASIDESLAVFTSLLSLDLSFNRISMIETTTFACQMDSLESLNLAGNQITLLERAAFTGLDSLRLLNISHNQLDAVSGDPFIHVPSNSCSKADPETSLTYTLEDTTTWTNFDTLDLSNNNITLIAKDLFQSAISDCRQLIFSHNNLQHFPRYGLEMLPRLEILLVDHNGLFWLDVGTFTSRTLTYIDISHNRLKKIISMTFLFLPDIKVVDLSHNKLNFIYKVAFYKSCKHNQRFLVDLTHNYLTEDVIWPIVTSFRHLTATECIVDLDVRHNRLRGIMGTSKPVYERHLLLMDAPYFNVWDHATLDIRENPINCDCTIMNDVALLLETQRMFEGNISNTHHLNFWEDVQCHLPRSRINQTIEHAMDNSICTSLLQCPFECDCYFDNITIVNCTRRELVSIPYEMPPGEKKLYFAQNYIMELEDGSYLDNVTYLDISSNALISIEPEVFERFTLPVTLLLHSNAITQLPMSVMLLENSSSRISLRGNPISCSCENWWLMDWMMNHTDMFLDYENTTCDDRQHPEDLDKDLVMSACLKTTVYKDRSGMVLYMVLGIALGIGFLSLVIVTLLIQSRRRIVPVLMNRLSWYRLNLEEQSSSKDDILLWYSPLDEDWVTANLTETLHHNLPLHSLYPYHQCLLQQDDQADRFSETHGCLTKSFFSAKGVVVVLSNNFLETEWSDFEDRQSQSRSFLFEDGFSTPLFFLSMEATKLSEHSDICDLIKGHCYHEVNEPMWMDSLLDNISSAVSEDHPRCDMDWTDDETLSLRDEKY